MSIPNVTIALLLSLLLGLSTTVSIAHNYSYHDDHPEHGEHAGSGCAYTVVQFTESLVTQLIHIVSLSIGIINKSVVYIGAQVIQPNNGFFARAPPL
jgi:hypothetical protein|tara:strand:+ start:564 stop:854 length:291 start_codon:yes stop_codon:yes gene_type:complete